MLDTTVPAGYRIVAIKPGGHRHVLGNATDIADAVEFAAKERAALAGHADVLVEPTWPSPNQQLAADALGINLGAQT